MEVTGGFCPTCGTPMFSEAELDNLGILAPTWACINNSLPRIDAQAPPVA
jgi:hypothetical protein